MKNKLFLISLIILTTLNVLAQKIQNPELLNAAKSGNEVRVMELIEKGADVNIRDVQNNGKTPLMWAALRGYFNTIKILIDNGAELNTLDDTYQSALELASFSGEFAIIKLLVESGAEINPDNPKSITPLMNAVNCVMNDQGKSQTQTDIVQFLIEKGAKLDPNILGEALMYPSATKPEVVKLLILNGADVNAKSLESFGGTTALIWAVDEGYLDIINLLIQKNANMNIQDSYNRTALMIAVKKNKIELSKLLIENGADVNSIGMQGSPLMIAAENGNSDLVNLLIKNNADIDLAKHWGETALMIAANKENLNIVELLINKGANLDAKKGNGQTALIEASIFCRTDIVKLLIDKKADLNIIDNIGGTALSYAQCNDVYNLLKNAGAR